MSTPSFAKIVSAELIKLKKTPLVWVAIIAGFVMASIYFIVYYAAPQKNISMPGDNCWVRYLQMSINIIPVILVPYVILITNSIVATAHHANSWKYLLSLPVKRGAIYMSKLTVLMMLIGITFISYLLTTIITGYLLGFIHPDQLEFHQHPLTLGFYVSTVFHSFLSVFGLASIQFFLSVQWRRFIIPVGIGVVLFISGSILGNSSAGIFHPYCYPIYISLIHAGKDISELSIRLFGWISNVELVSLFYFTVFSLLGVYLINVRDVKN